MKLTLTHAEVEQIVLAVVNNHYDLPMHMNRLDVGSGPAEVQAFTVSCDPARNGVKPTFWRRVLNTITFKRSHA